MKKRLHFFKSNKLFIAFLFLFSWVFLFRDALRSSRSWGDFKIYVDAPFWFFLKTVFIFWFTSKIKERMEKRFKKKEVSLKKYLFFFLTSIISYLIIVNVFSFLISLSFGTIARNYTTVYRELNMQIQSFVEFFIFGGFSLAYLYNKERNRYQKELDNFALHKAQMEVSQLKAQLNPHFLFNNLNILDQLIEEDTERASSFLNHFSDLYRYSIQSSEKELVTLQEELLFVEGYFKLLEEKYQGYYFLSIAEEVHQMETLVPPFCLQVLVENVIMHNKGTIEKPIFITVYKKHGICVSNNKIPYNTARKGNEIALKNLAKQYDLLAKETMKIYNLEDRFEVALPCINEKVLFQNNP